jgi:hypothetical protein
MSYVLRFWDFDMDSSVLGPIRCAHLQAEKKFAEFEESIRAGTVDSTELARNVFRAVAHRLTGDPEIDAKCGGAVFTEEEVATLPLDELDLFCDKLMKGRLMRVATADAAEHLPAAPAFQPGREGLATALLHVAERDRATWKRTTEAAERSIGSASLIAAQQAAGGGDAVARAMQEIRRSEDLVKSALGLTSMSSVSQAMADIRRNEDMVKAALGIDDRVKSFLDQTSMTAVTQAMADIRRSEDMFKAAAGIDENMKSILGPTSMTAAAQAVTDLRGNADIARAALGIDDHIKNALGDQASANAALEAMVGVRSLEEMTRRFADTISPALPDLAGVGGPGVVSALPAPRLEITSYRMPAPLPNPIHETNEIFGELLAHQKAEAGKKDADRSEAMTESGDNKKIAKSGLRYTKASFWLAFIAFLVATAWGVWVYWDAKADALENEQKSEIQLEKLRAEIRTLKASKSAPVLPAKVVGAPKPSSQTDAKPK